MASAFSDVKILDFSTGIAGPYLAMLLGDLGAEVVKVEASGGDPLRSTPGFLVWNRGKRGIKLNFKRREAREIIDRLVAKSDILIVNFDSPQSKALDLDYDSVKKRNPRLIFCSISPWGEKGPHAHKLGSGRVVSAYGGYVANQAGFTGNPVYTVMPYAEYKTALFGASGLTAALLARERTGQGQKLELSLLIDGALGWIWGEMLTTAIVDATTPFGHAPTLE